MNNNIANKNWAYIFYKYSLFTFLMLVSAINYNAFINPTKTVSGGTNGISIILEQLFELKPSVTIFAVSISILIITFVAGQYEKFISALYASVIYPFFVGITANISSFIEFKAVDIFIIVIFSGIISGIISGTICKLEMSQGGIVLLSQLFSKKYKQSVTKINFAINLMIVLLGGFIFGTRSIIYALIFLISNKKAMEKITIGVSKKKMFQIVTTEEKAVKEYISEILGVGYTIFSAKGGFQNKRKTVIMTAIPTKDYFRLKEGIHEIDKEAFIVITDSYQVHGGK